MFLNFSKIKCLLCFISFLFNFDLRYLLRNHWSFLFQLFFFFELLNQLIALLFYFFPFFFPLSLNFHPLSNGSPLLLFDPFSLLLHPPLPLLILPPSLSQSPLNLPPPPVLYLPPLVPKFLDQNLSTFLLTLISVYSVPLFKGVCFTWLSF